MMGKLHGVEQGRELLSSFPAVCIISLCSPQPWLVVVLLLDLRHGKKSSPPLLPTDYSSKMALGKLRENDASVKSICIPEI